MFWSFCTSFSGNSVPLSGCSALLGVDLTVIQIMVKDTKTLIEIFCGTKLGM